MNVNMETESPWKKLYDLVSRIKAGLDAAERLGDPLAPIIEKWTSGEVFFSHGELGSLILSGEDATQYRACVREIHRAVAGKRGQISVDSVRDSVQAAILKALDAYKSHAEPEFAKRLAKEIEELKSWFKRDTETYVIGLEVQGLALESLPAEFGSVKFRLLDELTLPELNAENSRAEESDEQREKRIEAGRVLRTNIANSVRGKIYAEAEVQALDQKAAVALAEDHLSLTLDVLNYFGDFFSEEGARIFLPGDAGTALHVAILAKKGEAERYAFGFSHKGPVFKFSFPREGSPAKAVEAFQKASALLRKTNRNPLEQRILAAIQWAGRAASDDRRDKAFLHYCISLEALLRAEGHGEIAFTFALRGAHVIMQDAGMRAELFRELKAFYGLRSKIAHEGRASVSDTDLKKIEILAKQAIFAVLVTEPFSAMTSNEHLEKWFADQQLAGVTRV
jgi:Apea-like HEPN